MSIKPKGLSDFLKEDPSLKIPMTYDEFKKGGCCGNIPNEHPLSEAYKEFCRIQDELKDEKYPNYVRLHNSIPWRVSYVYLDVNSDYEADKIFIENQIPVRFKGEFTRIDYPYAIIICTFSKRYIDRFIASMEKLNNVLLIKGHTDYPDACKTFQKISEEGLLWK